jgi:hypothetical protein
MERVTYTTLTVTTNVLNQKVELDFKWKAIKREI